MDVFVIKSRLPHLYYCENGGVLVHLPDATVYTRRAADRYVRGLLEAAGNDYAWSVLSAAEAKQLEETK